MNRTPGFISIVIPVYNEEKRIHLFLPRVIEFLRKKDFSYEMVIVDDGSSDRTVALVEEMLAQNLPGTYTIIRLSKNRERGQPLEKGCWRRRASIFFF